MASDKIYQNVIYFKQHFISLLESTSKTIKCIWLVLLICYVVSFFEPAFDIISITPGYLNRVWSVCTFCFLETHFLNVIIDIIATALCGKVIEPLWGPIEIISFFVVTNIGVAVLTTAFYLFIFVCTSETSLLFNVHIHGLLGYVAGITVAIKQIIPDILIINTPVGRVTNRNIPLLTVLMTFICWCIGLTEGSSVVMSAAGVYISWIYLRFYQKHCNGIIGDVSESFNFSSFFPIIMQPYIAVFANIIYNILVKMKLCKPHYIQRESFDELTNITIDHFNGQYCPKSPNDSVNKAPNFRIVGSVFPQKSKSQIKETDAVSVVGDNKNEIFVSTNVNEQIITDT